MPEVDPVRDPPGVRSPACSATDHPFAEGSSLASADTYFPACSHVWVRAKHDRSRPVRADRSRTAFRAPDPGSSSRLCFVCSHKPMISGGCPYFPGTLASDQVRNQLATAVLVDDVADVDRGDLRCHIPFINLYENWYFFNKIHLYYTRFRGYFQFVPLSHRR
jgi:hypothetical protein